MSKTRVILSLFLSFIIISSVSGLLPSVPLPAYGATTRGIRVTVREEGSSPKTMQLYDKMIAVIIGIDSYENLPAKNQLKYAVKDAKGVEEVLMERYPFTKIITMYDHNATRDNIMRVLQGKLALVGEDDAVFIYYAGHGITRSTQEGDLGFLIPYDGSLEMGEMHKNISMQQIKSEVSRLIPAKHLLFVLDACFGGLLLDTRGAGLEPGRTMAYLKEITREPVRQIITAGGKGEEVLDNGMFGHSVFTGRFIEALRNNKEYITAKELGFDIQRKVFGDAAARGHKQRPLEGKIYGTGDFVFVPDFEKLRKDSEKEVTSLEADIKRIAHLKDEASTRKEEAKLRELERESLLKESALKQARLRKNAARREEELRKKMEAEAIKDAAEMENRKRERKERLVYLKSRAEKMRRELGSPAAALGLADAQAEVKRLNTLMAKLDHDYKNELTKQLAPVENYYGQKISKAKNIEPRDEMFETELDYYARVSKAKAEENKYFSERTTKEDAIKKQVKNDLESQLKPLRGQRGKIVSQKFPVGHSDIKWKFGKYNLGRQEFSFSARVRGTKIIGNIPIPKSKAKEYFRNPELVVASAVLGISKDGSSPPLGFTVQGPEGDKYHAKQVAEGEIEAVTGSEFIRIPGGCFQMGDTFGDGGSEERPVQEVCVDTFYIGQHEVTQGEWKKIMGDNPSEFENCGDNCPVEQVSWRDAQKFIERLNHKTGKVYRIPTEAEWEYAARSGGKKEKWAGTSSESSLGDYAWYNGNSDSKTHPAKTKQPNGLGLYDMSGNVWEWVEDIYSSEAYSEHQRNNPIYTGRGSGRVFRGGSWYFSPRFLRAASRIRKTPGLRDNSLGFRLARTP